MQLERVRPAVLRATLHAAELSALISAARWLVEGSPGELPAEAREQLRDILASYDQQIAELNR